MRASRLSASAAVIFLVTLSLLYLRNHAQTHVVLPRPPTPLPTNSFTTAPPVEGGGPLRYANKDIHPIDQLVQDAGQNWESTLQRQSHSLTGAVREYKRRYKIPPPPHFDKWYNFATKKGVKLVDEYDTIYHSLLPFWGLSPATIRARTQEALGFDNQLVAIKIRDGKLVYIENGQDWLREALQGMLQAFVEYLPNMDLAFNVHDEPRVVVPHDQLSALLKLALDTNILAASSNTSPRNAFSAPPPDLRSSRRFDEVKTSRFNEFSRQQTWVPSRLSCPIDSPARTIEERLARDNLTAWALADLGFVYNQTAFSDICNSPSLEKFHGFFDRANVFNIAHELFPVFSQSKMSSFQDILYPSPWYWYGKVEYEKERDMDWDAKEESLWWRGSTTGGYSRDGGWRRQHRQRLIQKLNGLDQAKIMINNDNQDSTGAVQQWTVKEVPRTDFKDMIDVHFTGLGQCDPGDCDAQREFFHITEHADMQDTWSNQFLLDMDGNAFSGRFYTFLLSKSLTVKMAIFREWHDEWIKPWVHYIPVSLRSDETLEVIRYLSLEEQGRRHAEEMAEVSSRWAQQALRKSDFEAWFFRLLLEYGRLIDDSRESIGYTT